MRWLASGKLKSKIGRTESGQKTHLVSASDVSTVAESTRQFAPGWKRFERACADKGCIGASVLYALTADASDLDLFAHQIRLIDEGGDFLLFLSKQKRPDRSFAAKVARITGCSAEFRDSLEQREKDRSLGMHHDTKAAWRDARRQFFEFNIVLSRGCYVPAYLNANRIRNAPSWALESLFRYRKTETSFYDETLVAMLERCESQPSLRKVLDIVLGDRCGMGSDKAYLVEYFDLRPQRASLFLQEHWRRANLDDSHAIREHVDGKRKSVPRAVMNRIFGLSRAA